MSKKTNKFEYPHPLVKNLLSNKLYTPENINQLLKQKPNLYDNNYVFSPNIKNFISPKLMRLSNSKVIPQQKFGLLMQPFHAKQQVQLIQRNNIQVQKYKCQNCKAYLSNQCESLSLYEVKCRICEKVQSISPEVKNSLENIPLIYDISDHKESLVSNVSQRNVCFVIQASEYNYNYRVHEVIQSCLKSLESTLQSYTLQRKYSQSQTQDQQGSVKQNTAFQQQSTNQSISYNISFILFNDKNIFLINQSTKDIMVFNESFLPQYQEEINSQSLINFDDFFRPISKISEETFTLVKEILYDSHLKSSSCLDVTTEFIQRYVDRFMLRTQSNDLNQNLQNRKPQNKRQIQYKFFVNSLRFTKRIEEQQSEQDNSKIDPRGIFQNISNKITSNLPFTHKKSSQSHQIQDKSISQLTLNSNYEFFYLPQSTSSAISISQKEVIRKINNNLYKMYPQITNMDKKSNNNFFNQLYYDLFENLSTQKYFNIKINIKTSQNIQILAIGNQLLGYNDYLSQLKKIHTSKKDQKFNTYQMVLKTLEPNNVLPVDLKIKKKQNLKNNINSQTMHFMQISFESSKPFVNIENEPYNEKFTRVFHIGVASLERVINVRQRIYSSLSTYVDDQVLFYFYLRWILIQCHQAKTNHIVLKKLFQQMQKIADQFKDSYGHIDFHKQYVRIFLYSFMIINRPLMNGINENFYYERHQLIKNSMESFSKYLYARTYSIFKNKQTKEVDIKNVKSAPKNFKSDSLLLLDNGKNLFMIIGEQNAIEDLKNIFGTCFIHEIQQMTELPQLETNIQYRQMIEIARSQHESNFLPLKIMELFSPQFDSEISHFLYVKDNHQKFMRKLWDMQSAQNKRR